MSTDEESHSDQHLHTNEVVESQLANYELMPEHVDILRQYRDQWKNAKGHNRTKIAKEAYEKIVKEEGIDTDTSKAGKASRKLKRQVRVCDLAIMSVMDQD